MSLKTLSRGTLAALAAMLVLGAGASTIRLAPPLLIDQEQADFALNALGSAIRETEARA